jgi:hypothetical protein
MIAMFIKPGAATLILRVIAPPLCVPTTPAPAAKTRKRNLSLVLRIDALFMGGFKKIVHRVAVQHSVLWR